MVVLGLILVLVAVVAGAVLVYENSGSDHTVAISAFGGEWRADAYWLAVVGAAILLVLVLGVALIRGGGRRGLRRRQERKQLERENAALADRVRHTGPTPTVDDGRRADPPTSYDPMAKRSQVPPPAYEEQPPTTAR